MDTPSPLRGPSGVHPSPVACDCGAPSTVPSLDGSPSCAACAAAERNDPVAVADAAERRAEHSAEQQARAEVRRSVMDPLTDDAL